MSRQPISRSDMLRRTFGPRASVPSAGAVTVPPEAKAAQVALRGADALERHVLEMRLARGETGYVRRSSLMLAEGRFAMHTRRIASKRVPIMGLFSGQALWANRFTAETATRLVAGRDYHGLVLSLDVTPERDVWLQPALYLGHQGDLSFTVKRVAKREFWTLTRVTGTGTVHLKAPGRTFTQKLLSEDVIVDTNYVAAIRGTFTAHGKVFSAGQYLKSGEAENVRLMGEGDVLMQTELPPESGSGGGLFGGLIDLFV